jgi:hypothetical protein
VTEKFGLGLGYFGSVFGLRLIMPRASYGARGFYKTKVLPYHHVFTFFSSLNHVFTIGYTKRKDIIPCVSPKIPQQRAGYLLVSHYY